MVVVPILIDILHPDVSISRNVVMTMVTMLRYIIPFCTYTYYTHRLRIQHSNTTVTTPGSHCYRGVSKVNWFALPELPYWLPMAFLYHWGERGRAGRKGHRTRPVNCNGLSMDGSLLFLQPLKFPETSSSSVPGL